jgi:hypothetical protein
VGLALVVGDMMVSRKGVFLHLKQGGTADYFALDLRFAGQGFFVVKFSEILRTKRRNEK